jgi:hypothetical protein
MSAIQCPGMVEIKPHAPEMLGQNPNLGIFLTGVYNEHAANSDCCHVWVV